MKFYICSLTSQKCIEVSIHSVSLRKLRNCPLLSRAQVSRQRFCFGFLLFILPLFSWQFTPKSLCISRVAHCLITIMNHQRISNLWFCTPVLLGIHRNLNWKEFLKFRESFLRKVSVCTLTDLNPEFDGP